MILEQRDYTCGIGDVPRFWALFSQQGLKIQRRILGGWMGHYSTETGDLGIVVHLWAYESYADRDQRRWLLAADPDWQAYQKKRHELGIVVKQQCRILRAAPFTDALLKAMLAAGNKAEV